MKTKSAEGWITEGDAIDWLMHQYGLSEEGWITEGDAIDWLMHQYGLSEGAAIPQLRRALASGNVQCDDLLVKIGRDGKPVHVPARISLLIPDRFVHDLRLHVGDLRWQIEQQIGSSPTGDALPAPCDAKEQRSRHGPVPSAPAIRAAAKKLHEQGKSPNSYKTFEDYRRALCEAAGVDPNTRGWLKGSVRNALKA